MHPGIDDFWLYLPDPLFRCYGQRDLKTSVAGKMGDLEQIHLIVESIQVILRVSLPLISCHGWHSEPNRQCRLLDLRTEGRSCSCWSGLDVLGREFLKLIAQLVDFVI